MISVAPLLPAKRSFSRDDARSRGPATKDENMLVKGDNIDALAWLGARRGGAFRCAYLDPPFNTGRTFAEYDDARAPGEWLAMMQERLVAIRPLLADDGAIFVEIDDTELGPLQGVMDSVFGRANRVSTVTIVRSAGTGHKAKNRGPVNVTDFLLVYEKTKGSFRYTKQTRTRRGYDYAYATHLVNADRPYDAWEFEPLARAVARSLGHATGRGATRALGREAFDRALVDYALHHAEKIVRFAQPRYEAVSQEARQWIDRSRTEPSKVLRLERPGHPDMILRGGNRILFLSSKVVTSEGRPRIVEPLTNVWDDMPFQGIAREGGVVFARNKKPERLLERILAMSTEPGDWVLDPFLGSGTTAAVAHKMRRRWVGIEAGHQMWDLCVPRLSRVVDGDDDTGVTRRESWRGGGGFGVYV